MTSCVPKGPLPERSCSFPRAQQDAAGPMALAFVRVLRGKHKNGKETGNLGERDELQKDLEPRNRIQHRPGGRGRSSGTCRGVARRRRGGETRLSGTAGRALPG